MRKKISIQGYEKRITEERNKNCKEKVLLGEYIKQTEVMDENSWRWLKNGQLKKETEGLIIAAQDQALRTKLSSTTSIKQVKHHCADCAKKNRKQRGMSSVRAQNLPRKNTKKET